MLFRSGTVVDADDLMQNMIAIAAENTRQMGKIDDFSQEEFEKLSSMIGLGALKYFILKVDPRKNMLFNPEESIDMNGNTAPFIQYTHARIASLTRKAETENIDLSHCVNIDILPKEERRLISPISFSFILAPYSQQTGVLNSARRMYQSFRHFQFRTKYSMPE